MGNHEAVEVDPKELEKAQVLWDGFTFYSKIAIGATCGILALLALILL